MYPLLRVTYSTWQDAMRQIATIFNTHKHEPYSKTSAGVGTSTTLDDDNHTVSVTTSGLTITLPAANSTRLGQDWTVHLGVAGYVDITIAGSDTFVLPEIDSTIRLDVKGSSVTLRCLTTTTWGIV